MKALTDFITTVVIGMSSIFLLGCTNEIDFGPVTPPDPEEELPECAPERVHFFNDVMPVLESHCAIPGCHDAESPAAKINLSTYEDIMAATIKGEPIVIPGNRNNSVLFRAVMPEYLLFMPPSRSHQLTPKMRNDIGRWIQQGAVKDGCKTECDDREPVFGTTIRPIISKYCTGCHYDKFPQADIELHSYATIKEIAETGDLIKTMRGEEGVSAMPPGLKMPECEIKLVEEWIARGMPRD